MCDVKCYMLVLYIYIYHIYDDDDDDKIAEEKKNGGDVVPSKKNVLLCIVPLYISASTYFVWYKQVLD